MPQWLRRIASWIWAIPGNIHFWWTVGIPAMPALIAWFFAQAKDASLLVTVVAVVGSYLIALGATILLLPRVLPRLQTYTTPGAQAARVRDETPATRLPDGRTLVDVTPRHLARLSGEHAEIQADKLLEAFVGKWMRVSGAVEDVFAMSENIANVTFPYEGPENPSVIMEFTGKSIIDDQLRVLKKGDWITVIGQIESASPYVIGLINCELETR